MTPDELEQLKLYNLLMQGAPGRGKLAGGVVTIAAAVPPGNELQPSAMQQWLEWAGEPQSVEWQLQFTWPDTSTDFPPIQSTPFSTAGALGWEVLFSANDNIVARIDMGSGPTARTIYTDVRPGRFSLGVQERVKISVGRWQHANAFDQIVTLQGTVGPAQSSCDPPTYSAATTIAAADAIEMNVPTGATWFDFFPAETGSQLQATVRPVNSIARQFFYRDSTVAAPVVFPPSTPHALGADAGVLRIANVGALTSNVEVVFWVR